MHTTWPLGLFTLGLVIAAADRLPAFAADEAEAPRVTLLGSLEEWMYPKATMPHGATMSNGDYSAPMTVHCHAVLETKDDFAKVIAFYEKLVASQRVDSEGGAVEPLRQTQSAATVDDSEGRPVKVRVITVNRPRVSTTLVVSQGAGEKVTHIAWSQHRDLEPAK